jgi:hypothetical protein
MCRSVLFFGGRALACFKDPDTCLWAGAGADFVLVASFAMLRLRAILSQLPACRRFSLWQVAATREPLERAAAHVAARVSGSSKPPADVESSDSAWPSLCDELLRVCAIVPDATDGESTEAEKTLAVVIDSINLLALTQPGSEDLKPVRALYLAGLPQPVCILVIGMAVARAFSDIHGCLC